VVAAVIERNGRILIAQRKANGPASVEVGISRRQGGARRNA